MSNPGVSNHISKLNDEAVRDIRTSRRSFTALAKRYNVSIQTVHAAATGQTWSHIDTPPRAGRKSLKDRILDGVEFDTNGGCWLWSGRRNKTHDRGLIKINDKATNASRASFLAFTGIDPGRGFVCHKCDVSLCVNPDHLYLGDVKTNARDRSERGSLSPRLGQERADQIRNANGTLEQVSRAFGVSMETAYRVRRGLAWRQTPTPDALKGDRK